MAENENEYDFILDSKKKEDKLVRWAASQKGMNLSRFCKDAVLEKAKTMFVQQKKKKEEVELKKKEAIEKEETELIKEIETTGELELRKKYEGSSRKKEEDSVKTLRVKSEDEPPAMEGEIEPVEPEEYPEDAEELLEEPDEDER